MPKQGTKSFSHAEWEERGVQNVLLLLGKLARAGVYECTRVRVHEGMNAKVHEGMSARAHKGTSVRGRLV